ncbi:MAG: ATP-binding protein [Thermodesulfobacteriota bacterium]
MPAALAGLTVAAMPMRLSVHTSLRAFLLLFGLASSAAMLFITARVTTAVGSLAERSLESTAFALAFAVESALLAGEQAEEVQRILSDRVVAYALVADAQGTILFHTNPELVGSRLPAAEAEPPRPVAGRPGGQRLRLGTQAPAFAFSYPLRSRQDRPELLRLVLHTAPVDRIAGEAQGLWGGTAALLAVLWALAIGLERILARQLRLQADLARSERLALVGQMTATLAHEIRNALGSTKGFAQWVDEKTGPEDPRKAGLAAVLAGTERIDGLVEGLLLYARGERYCLAPVDAGQALRQAAATCPQPGCTTVEAPDRIRVLGDAEKLHRVLANGIRNALEAGGDGAPVRLVARPAGRRVLIRIEDRGPGIPADSAARLFTPFFTTKAAGTGLGLAYARKVIEGMRGEIALANRDGGGAVLSIWLPRG